METSTVDQMPLAGEVLAEEAHMSLAARIGDTIRSGYEHARNNLKTYAAIGTASLALSGAELTTATERAAAENAPAANLRRPVINSYRMGVGTAVEVQDNGINYLDAATLSTDPSAPVTELTPEQKQECIDVALAKPEIVKAEVIHAGQYRPEPNQRFFLSTRYEPMPDECKSYYSRGNKAKVQAWHDGKWQNVTYWHGVSIIRETNAGNWEDLGNERGIDFPICNARILLQATMVDLSVDTGSTWYPHPIAAKKTFAPIPVTLLPRKPKAC